MSSDILAIPGSPTPIGGENVFVIADIGKNFIQTSEEKSAGEYLSNAIALIDAAADAGADAVKFQTHTVDDEQYPVSVTSPHAPDLDRYKWVERNTRATPLSFWQAVKRHADERGVLFFSTPMSRGAARVLESLDIQLWKVASGDVRDALLLSELIRTGKPIVLSTGMVSFAELKEVMDFLRPSKIPLVLLYCISKYPCPPEDFNLASIGVLAKEYPDAIVGFSDHSIGVDVPLAAAGAGARVVEKHFSHSRDLWGPDHKVSMTPEELRELTSALKAGEHRDPAPYLGSADRELEGAGNAHRPYFGKALVAARDLPAGISITDDDLYAMRPILHISGLPAWEFPRVLGRKTSRPLKRYDAIDQSALQ